MSVSLPDFNTLKAMAQNDPEGLEQLRRDQIEALIQSAPEGLRPRLRGLQFQIDSQRRLAKNPLQSCIQISRMMHDSFHQLREKLHDVAQGKLFEPGLEAEFDRVESAQIIAFPVKA